MADLSKLRRIGNVIYADAVFNMMRNERIHSLMASYDVSQIESSYSYIDEDRLHIEMQLCLHYSIDEILFDL